MDNYNEQVVQSTRDQASVHASQFLCSFEKFEKRMKVDELNVYFIWIPIVYIYDLVNQTCNQTWKFLTILALKL